MANSCEPGVIGAFAVYEATPLTGAAVVALLLKSVYVACQMIDPPEGNPETLHVTVPCGKLPLAVIGNVPELGTLQ